MTSPHELARKYSGARPGFELIHYAEVGVPFYRLVLDSLVQRRKPIGPIEEFVLRAVHEGLDQLDDVGGMLGVDRTLVEQAVVDLSKQDVLDYTVDGGRRVLRVTSQGERALEGWIDLVPDRQELFVGFDRMTWSVKGRYYRSLIRPKDAREQGLIELPPRLKRRIAPADLDLDQTQRAVGEVLRDNLQGVDLISVIDAGNHRMVLPAVALVYASVGGADQQVAIAVDGRLSEPHGLAFAELDGPARVGLVVEGAAGADERPDLPDDLVKQRADRAEVARLEERIAGATSASERARTVTATAMEGGAPDEVAAAQATADDAVASAAEAQEALKRLPIRSIQTYEHRALLADAMATAQRRLLIISPWVRGDVVDQPFLDALNRRAAGGVDIHIGWGISGDDDDERGRGPVAQLVKMASRHPNVVVRRLGNTHAKILIWDEHLVVTSFNWLSFRGDKRRAFRQEEGTLISDSGYVDLEYQKYRSQITQVEGFQ